MTDWQKQNFKKSGSSAPSSMHSKIGTGSSTLHSKIAPSSARKYADGGFVQDDATGVDEAVAANKPVYEDDTPAKSATNDEVRAAAAEAESVAAAESPKKQSFKEAFAENRKAGNKEFEWNGTKFSTKFENEVKAPPKPKASAPAPAPSSSPAKTFSEDVAERKANRLPSAMSRNENYGNESRRQVMPRPTGRGIIDTSGIDPKTLLPKR